MSKNPSTQSSRVISISPTALKPRFAHFPVLGPTIVAESLVAVPEPLVTALRPGPSASAADVSRALAWSLRPAEECTAPPPWLLPHQVHSFRRVLAALRRFGGALLADPVGSGKTYVALAVASALGRWPASCVVPAPLVAQWRTIATRLGVPAVVGSHQQASRGRLPPSDRGLVIIDEGHHFRNPCTRRYREIAPWLVGRPTLLLTATPIVNRLPDLAAQLLLGVRSDALASDGVPSLRALLAAGRSPPALGRLIVETTDAGTRPRRAGRVSQPEAEECQTALELLAITDRLQLSQSRAIAALIRGVLDGAAASSPAALSAALRRYRALLLHARDAAAAGRRVDYAEIRRFTGSQHDQLVLWEMVSDAAPSADIDLTDLHEIDTMIEIVNQAARGRDGKVERLQKELADRRPTLVFTTRRETVRYLRDRLNFRDRLDDRRVAWCTGERAGLGHVSMPREVVWGWFGAAPTVPNVPSVLVTTDVAAEGLDLRRIERVIHYDLPYTPMRLEQREGRAIRLGSQHGTVDVVRFIPPQPLERRLGQVAALAQKARLPGAAGLGPEGRGFWRWRAEVAERLGAGEQVEGVAAVAAGPAGVLAGYSIDSRTTTILWLDQHTGHWTEEPEIVSARLGQAIESAVLRPVHPDALRRALAQLADPLRLRLAIAAGRRWIMPDPGLAARELAARLQTQVLAAARRRDASTLRRLDQTLRFLASGHTAGEEVLIQRTAALPDAALASAIDRLPVRQRTNETPEVRLTGIVLFEPE